jgi:hypothetical protein
VIEPLRLSFDVACPAAHAFQVWTERIAAWWPLDHTVSGQHGLCVVLEPYLGGRIFERTQTGEEHPWGQVTVWEPPRRLGYRWHIGRESAQATDVEITFVAVHERATRVEIVHRGWERLGAEAPVWRDRNVAGWSSLLPHFVAAAEG